MWLTTEYESVTLFSLRLSTATSSGGKTLLVPTPYAIKMALLDVACRALGAGLAEQRWGELRELQVALRPAAKAVVTNLFQKVLKPYKNPPKPGEPDFGPFQRTIGYREYTYLEGPLGVGLGWDGSERRDWLADLLVQVNYFGKRGSFMQVTQLPKFTVELPAGYVLSTRPQEEFPVGGTLQLLDDCAENLPFAKANIYSGEKLRSGKDRITRHIILPYRLSRSSKTYSLYEHFEL